MKHLLVGQKLSMNTENIHTTTSGTNLADKIAWTLFAVMMFYEVLK